MKRQPREAYDFVRQPLDHIGERTAYQLAVEEVMTRYPDMLPGTAMQCVTIEGSISWKLAHELGEVRKRPDDLSKAPAMPRERRAVTGMGHALPRESFRSEAEFGRVALHELKKLPGVMAWRVNSGRRGGVSFGGIIGAPDIQGIVGRHGRFFAVELKTMRGRTTPEQDAWHARAIERGGLVWVARTLDEVIRPLVEAMG